MRAIASWSGGKDSAFACYQAMKEGYEIEYLLNFISKEHKRCCFHGLEAKLVQLQADLIGIPLVQKEVTADMQKYEEEFKEAVLELKAKGIQNMVFGDLYLLEQFSWVERVCREIDIQPIEPLWNRPPKEIVRDFIDAGFKAVVVSCQADKLGKQFIGRLIDADFVQEVSKMGICPCGENGEFHTVLVDGPIFSKPIEITKAEAVLKQGFWKYWFLDIQEYRIN